MKIYDFNHNVGEINRDFVLHGLLVTKVNSSVENLEDYFSKERIFTLTDIYDSSLFYMMILVNIMIYVAVIAYIFSREYAESTLKTVLPIPISRAKLLLGKFCALFLWIVMLTLVTWGGVLLLSSLYHIFFVLEGYNLLVAIKWLPKFIFGSILMFLTVTPFAYIAQREKGLLNR